MADNGLPPLPQHLLPCPFCGSVLKRDDKGNTGAQHLPNTPCPLSGWFIGARNLQDWQRRQTIAPVLTMTVADGRPVFHDDATGRIITARELNLYIEWYEAQRAKTPA